jgi:hypothetical protein
MAASLFLEGHLMDFSSVADLIKQFGPLFVAVVFFLWRDWKREDRLSQRINVLEDEQRNVIMPLVEKCSAVIAENTVVISRLEASIANRDQLEKAIQRIEQLRSKGNG